MRFRFEQTIAAPVADVSAAFADPRYYGRLGELPKLGRPEVLDRHEDDGVVRMQIRYRFTGDLSSAARKLIDPAKLTWVEHSTHDLAHHVVDFTMVPDHYGDRLSSSGRCTLTGGDGVTSRVVEGELVVRVRFVGGPVERAIVSGLGEHIAAEAAVVELWLSECGGL